MAAAEMARGRKLRREWSLGGAEGESAKAWKGSGEDQIELGYLES